MKLGWGPGSSEVRFCCACHAFRRSRGRASGRSAVAGNTCIFWPQHCHVRQKRKEAKKRRGPLLGAAEELLQLGDLLLHLWQVSDLLWDLVLKVVERLHGATRSPGLPANPSRRPPPPCHGHLGCMLGNQDPKKPIPQKKEVAK